MSYRDRRLAERMRDPEFRAEYERELNLSTAPQAYEALHVATVVEARLLANGDWNINDWKDVAGVLARHVLRASQTKSERATGGF